MAVLKRALRNNALSLVAFALFAVALIGHFVAGYSVDAETRREHHGAAITPAGYLTSGHFLESVFENWESEFLQMALFVVLTAWLMQRGSAESKKLPEEELENDEVLERVTEADRRRSDAPWPVRAGGLALSIYAHSLSIALGVLFAISFAMHAQFGLVQWNSERAEHGQAAASIADYMLSARFWFESFQNWQSEFLAVAVLVVLTIFLRERGSEQSKAVGAPHAQTGI